MAKLAFQGYRSTYFYYRNIQKNISESELIWIYLVIWQKLCLYSTRTYAVPVKEIKTNEYYDFRVTIFLDPSYRTTPSL